VRKSISLVSLALVLATVNPSVAAPPGDRLVGGEATPRGSVLTAGTHGAAYELRGGARVLLAEGTEYSFEPSIRLKIRKPGDPDTLARSIRIVHGQADVVVPAGAEAAAVLLRSPGKMSAVAKEGRSTFVVGDDRATAASREGEMLVGIGNDWKPLREGFARTLSPQDPAALPHPILGAPEPSVEHALLVQNGEAPASAALTWTALRDATAYDVSVSRVEAGKTTLVSHQQTSDTRTTVPSLTPGAYSVTVAAVDRSGLSGVPAASRTIRVVGVRTPEGAATIADGTIVMGRDQRVSLVAAEGLEVGYGGSQVFGAAPDSIGLAHGTSTLARLRLPGTAEETVLHLEPEGLRASVQVGPRAARWPLDTVSIEVDLYDAAGRPVPEDARISTSVTVNLEPAPVVWERSGRVLRTTVPASAARGPWVVRAEVNDERGNLIGRGFLEVDRTAAPARARVARR